MFGQSDPHTPHCFKVYNMSYEVDWAFYNSKDYKKARRLGPDTFGEWLAGQAQLAEAEGNEELEFYIWYELLNMFGTRWDDAQMSAAAAKLARLRPPDGNLAMYSARSLFRVAGMASEALCIVRNGYAAVAAYEAPESVLPFNWRAVADWAGLARAEVTILAATDPGSPRIQELLAILCNVTDAGSPLDDEFIDALATLHKGRRLPRSFYGIVESEWSRWARQLEFEGRGERLVKLLRSIAKRLRR